MTNTHVDVSVVVPTYNERDNVPLVVELPPPPVVPGKQPFWNVGVPASSRYLDTRPKHVPCTVPLPEKARVCFGKYSEPDSVRHDDGGDFAEFEPPVCTENHIRVY